MSECNHNQIREAFEPFRLALEKNETDTLGRLLSDDERLFSMAGSWTQPTTVTLGDLRKLAKVINGSPIDANQAAMKYQRPPLPFTDKLCIAVGECISDQSNGFDVLASASWDRVVEIWDEEKAVSKSDNTSPKKP